MANCDSCIVLQEKVCNGYTNDIAAANNDGMLARNCDVISAQEFDAALWRVRVCGLGFVVEGLWFRVGGLGFGV